jgi:hypothetical protein
VYPPRADLVRAKEDVADVEMFEAMNPFDIVSQATPPSGVPAYVSWSAPMDVPRGTYVLWVEVSREFDHNATYSPTTYPSPAVSFAEYGEAYRGQPSVVYRVPFELGEGTAVASTLDYVGYGDPEGLDGVVRPPDATITTGVPGSGADRFAVRADGGEPFRLRVKSRVEIDIMGPAAPMNIQANTITANSATIEMIAPGDDGLVGKVRSYEIRYIQGRGMTEDNFASAMPLNPDMTIGEAGTLQEFTIDKLLFDTEYTVGVRANDDCRHTGPLVTYTFKTAERGTGEVDACFIATAAYGSTAAGDVPLLRSFRDRVLRGTVLGELATEAYYTFSPAISVAIGESELLRETTRAMLDPLVRWVRAFTF